MGGEIKVSDEPLPPLLNERQTAILKRVGNVFAYVSFFCSVSWFAISLIGMIPAFSRLHKMGVFEFFKIAGVGVVFAGISAICRARLWKVALPVSLVMFLFIMYVMGS